MTPKERLIQGLGGEATDRVPFFPKIWIDLAAALTGTDLCDVIEDPELALKIIVDAAVMVKADGARQFLFPKRKVVRDGEQVYEVDEKGKRLGSVDMAGGLATQLDDDAYFRIDDPYFIAHSHQWKTSGPLIEGMSDVRRLAVPEKQFFEQAGFGDLQRRMIAYAGDRVGLVGDLGSGTLPFHVAFRGMENGLIDLFDKPELVQAIFEKGAACVIERGKFNIDCGHRVLRLNDSMANMELISPDQWRAFIFPHFKAICDELHGYQPDVKIYCHICGNVLPIVEMLVEAGLDAIAPLDPLGQFTVADVRQRVGDDVVLMGGVNTLSFIQSTHDEIQTEAKTCIEQGVVRGNRGFVLGSGCVVPRATTKEMMLAVAETTSHLAETS
ncbi:uroporphyrinogen decarboxylase family protein [Poriferisphaera sp. WC338]|uniref:uroporphyrinogen decarboxylase family protein n=1 Tax=Poriferisphaera sp. WC338 TaxID=3425129 RepID=UPI003D817928